MPRAWVQYLAGARRCHKPGGTARKGKGKTYLLIVSLNFHGHVWPVAPPQSAQVGTVCIARPWRRSRGADVHSRGPGLSPGCSSFAEGELQLKAPASSSARWAVTHTALSLPTHASLTWAQASCHRFLHCPGLFALLQEGDHIRFGNSKTWT